VANDVFYLTDSAVFQCMDYRETVKVRKKILFLFNVSRGNKVNTKASPLFIPCRGKRGIKLHRQNASFINFFSFSFIFVFWPTVNSSEHTAVTIPYK
jgi:hypothetical protein